MMLVVCAWCRSLIRVCQGVGVSHGICARCSLDVLGEADPWEPWTVEVR